MDHNITQIEAIPASTTGALAGFEARCSCGLVMRNTVRTNVELDMQEHVHWATRAHKGR